MRKLLALFCIALAVAAGPVGCSSGNSVEIPDQPVPPPDIDPVKAGSSLTPAAPNGQRTPG